MPDVLAVQQATWLGVVGALVPSVIALIAAIVGVLNRRQLNTGSAKSIGQIATEVSGNLATANGKTVGEMLTEVHGEAATPGTAYEQHGPAPPTKGA